MIGPAWRMAMRLPSAAKQGNFMRMAQAAKWGLAFAAVLIPVGSLAQVTSGFGTRADPFHGKARQHSGVDLGSPVGTPIYATADGVVGRAGWVGSYGNLVEINHAGGYQTRYAHMHKIHVRSGQRIRRGTIIGQVGSTGRSTGPHLHYEVRLNGKALDPSPFMRAAPQVRTARSGGAAGQVGVGGPGR